MIEGNVRHQLQDSGFAEVVVVNRAEADPGAILDLFMPDVPEAAGGASRQFATRHSRHQRRAARSFPELGMTTGYIGPDQLALLAAHPQVRDIHLAQPLSLIGSTMATGAAPAKLTWGLQTMGIPALWRRGHLGQNVRVGHIDTGLDGRHPSLRSRIEGFVRFRANGRPIAERPTDQAGHGTHTAGTICGGQLEGARIGIAPEVRIFSAKVIDSDAAQNRSVMGAIQWMIDRRVRVVNLSLGIGRPPGWLRDGMMALRQNGILPVAAIGNVFAGTALAPARFPEVLSVGAVAFNRRVPTFSSSQRFNRPAEPVQPDVVAPGVKVFSASPGGRALERSGTSMAAAHVTGAAALLFGAFPRASAGVAYRALLETATALPNQPPLRFGRGFIRPLAALRRVAELMDGD